jgi:hypothetical protein
LLARSGLEGREERELEGAVDGETVEKEEDDDEGVADGLPLRELAEILEGLGGRDGGRPTTLGAVPMIAGDED